MALNVMCVIGYWQVGIVCHVIYRIAACIDSKGYFTYATGIIIYVGFIIIKGKSLYAELEIYTNIFKIDANEYLQKGFDKKGR